MRRAVDSIAILAVVACSMSGPAVRAQDAHPPGALADGHGTLVLTVTPRAIVLVDNEEIGDIESTRIELPAGIHRLRIAHADYEPLRRTITIREGEEATLSIDLADKALPRRRGGAPLAAAAKPAPPAPAAQGELRLSIRPESQIWVDDELKGSGGSLTLRLPAGRHSIRVVHPDYQPLLRRVVVGAQPATLTLDLAERGVRRSTH